MTDTTTDYNNWTTNTIDNITNLAKQIGSNKLRVEDIPSIPIEETLAVMSTLAQIAIEGIIRDITSKGHWNEDQKKFVKTSMVDRGHPIGGFTRGADDSFYDYIPGGLDVLNSVYRLGVDYYTDNSLDTPEATTNYVKAWLETMDPTNLYMSGDCSGNLEPYILRLYKQFNLPTDKFDEDDITDYTEAGQL